MALQAKLLLSQFSHFYDKLLCGLDFWHYFILCQAEAVIIIACQAHVEQTVKEPSHFRRENTCLYKMLPELPNVSLMALRPDFVCYEQSRYCIIGRIIKTAQYRVYFLPSAP